ncbi:hypothetical protein DL768_004133 [Monosporascus sp. mg162]|nr:hypothetical protein DL768_004133 [Monosporascus sp. mg162]
MAKIRWIERQPVIHHVEVIAKNDADDVVTSAAFAVAEEPEKPEAAVPENESDFEKEVILESEDEDVVTEPLIEEFLPAKLTNQKKLHGNNFRNPLKPLKGNATLCSAFDGRTKALIITCPVIGARISYTMKRKKHALTALMNAVVFLERQHHIKVKTIVSNGKISFGKKLRRWLLDTGISHKPSPPYTKEPVGVQERAGGVIITKARYLMISSNLPSDLWPKAVKAATYIANRTPTKALGWKTPIQVLNEWIAKKDKIPVPEEGLKANVANVILFGSKAYALTEAVRRGAERLKKMDLRAYIGYLVGYVASNIYRVWVPLQQRVITVRDVTFDETKKYRGDQQQKSSIEIAELNDQIDSILIPPKATTFLGTSRAIFSSDPLDTGVTGGVNDIAVHDTVTQGPSIEDEEPIYDTIVVATGDPD